MLKTSELVHANIEINNFTYVAVWHKNVRVEFCMEHHAYVDLNKT